MPELPEVEVIRLFLENKLVGKKIKKIEILNEKSFKGNIGLVEGQPIIGFIRLGKQLSIKLENSCILLVHLKMTGQLVFLNHDKTILGHPTPKQNNSPLPNKSTRIIFTFSDNTKLFFNDQRKFGWIRVFTPNELDIFQSNLGKDILSNQFSGDYLFSQLQKTSRPIKSVLLDQSKFAGIGNIYANDALFLSKIHPATPAKHITKKQALVLSSNLVQLMKESVLHGGSTAKDNGYIRPDGSFGQHQYFFRVYQKEGEHCLNCQTPIQRIKIGGRSAFFCPKCQTKQ